MKIIKIKKNDEACIKAIDAALKAVNGKAHSFAITDPQDVVLQGVIFTNDLELLPRRDQAEAIGTYTPAGPSAKAYKFGVDSTALTFEMGKDGKTVWLKSIEKVTVWPRNPERRDVALKRAAHDHYVAARARDFSIQPDA